MIKLRRGGCVLKAGLQIEVNLLKVNSISKIAKGRKRPPRLLIND